MPLQGFVRLSRGILSDVVKRTVRAQKDVERMTKGNESLAL